MSARVRYRDGMTFFRTSLAAAILAAVLGSAAQAQMMGGHAPPIPMTAKQFAAASTGQSVQIAVRVDRRKRAAISGELLDHQTDAVSKATGKHVMLYLADGTPIVMGTAADVVPGAVLFVYGVVTKPGHVDVKRLVVDTKYVRVE